MTRRQRDEWKFRLLLAFSVLCMTVDYVDEPKHTEPNKETEHGYFTQVHQ